MTHDTNSPPLLTRYMSFSLRFLGFDFCFKAFITRLVAGSEKCWLKASSILRKESASCSSESSGGGLSMVSIRNSMNSTSHKSERRGEEGWNKEEEEGGWQEEEEEWREEEEGWTEEEEGWTVERKREKIHTYQSLYCGIISIVAGVYFINFSP